jgi:hypothetical protein
VVYYLEFGDYCRIAAEVLGVEPEQVANLPNIGLADSALAAPRAGFGDYEAYPTLTEKGPGHRRAHGGKDRGGRSHGGRDRPMVAGAHLLKPTRGLEPRTPSLRMKCSTN